MTPGDTVLAAVDLEGDGRRVAEVAASFALAAGAKLRLVHVSCFRDDENRWDGAKEIDAALASYRGRLRERIDVESAALEELRAGCEAKGLACEADLVEGRPWEAIIEHATRVEAALVVVGSHTSENEKTWKATVEGLTGRLLGTTADKLVRYSPCPVVVACTQNEPRGNLDGARWLVAMDLTPHSLAGLDVARDVAKGTDGELLLMHVVAPIGADDRPGSGEWSDVLEQHKRREAALRMDELVAEKTEGTHQEQVERIAFGSPADELCRAADELGADVLVIGTHGRKGLDRFLLGSTAERCLRQVRIPVLVVRSEG